MTNNVNHPKGSRDTEQTENLKVNPASLGSWVKR